MQVSIAVDDKLYKLMLTGMLGNDGVSWTTMSLNSRSSDSARSFHLDDLVGLSCFPETELIGTLNLSSGSLMFGGCFT